MPVVVLAQAWRGGPQPRIARVLKGCEVVPDDETIGRAAGFLCAASDTSDVVDAIVVANAAPRMLPVVTSDPDDIEHLADAIGIKLRLYVV